jgi:hypothetical protein
MSVFVHIHMCSDFAPLIRFYMTWAACLIIGWILIITRIAGKWIQVMLISVKCVLSLTFLFKRWFNAGAVICALPCLCKIDSFSLNSGSGLLYVRLEYTPDSILFYFQMRILFVLGQKITTTLKAALLYPNLRLTTLLRRHLLSKRSRKHTSLCTKISRHLCTSL